MVRKLFITLHNVSSNSRDLRINNLIFTLDKYFSSAGFFITKRWDCNFYVFVWSTGVSPKTYRYIVKALFPEFKDSDFSIKGVKSISGTIDYMLQSMKFRDLLDVILNKRIITPYFFCDSEFNFLDHISNHNRFLLQTFISILNYNDFEAFKLAELSSRKLVITRLQKKLLPKLWENRQLFLSNPKARAEFIDSLNIFKIKL